MSHEHCKNCAFIGERLNGNSWDATTELYCRRFPPIPVSQYDRHAPRTAHPVVYEDDWCGEWKESP